MRLLNRFESLPCLVSIVFSSRECLDFSYKQIARYLLVKSSIKIEFQNLVQIKLLACQNEEAELHKKNRKL